MHEFQEFVFIYISIPTSPSSSTLERRAKMLSLPCSEGCRNISGTTMLAPYRYRRCRCKASNGAKADYTSQQPLTSLRLDKREKISDHDLHLLRDAGVCKCVGVGVSADVKRKKAP
jgi:hypothetical protein